MNLIVDFTHEKGPQWQNAPYMLARCPSCKTPLKITGIKMQGSNAISHTMAEEVGGKAFRDGIANGVPQATVAKEPQDNSEAA